MPTRLRELPGFAECRGVFAENTTLSKLRRVCLARGQLASLLLCQAEARRGSSGSAWQRKGYKAAVQVKWEDVWHLVGCHRSVLKVQELAETGHGAFGVLPFPQDVAAWPRAWASSDIRVCQGGNRPVCLSPQ